MNMKIAVLVPCYNEERTAGEVTREFLAALPGCTVYVYDNNSTDKTSEVARAAGAIVGTERQKGKGNVVRRMFSDIDADIYVLVDGDSTYEAQAAPRMVKLLVDESLDMVNGCRVEKSAAAYRLGHRFGNQMLTGMVALIFGRGTKDMLTGYRVFSRRFVKSFPALARGFETETELMVHALELRMPIADADTIYLDRPEGSVSKLNTLSDGFRILRTISSLVREERPLQFFGSIAAVLALVSLVLAYPIFTEFLATHLVPRFPTAILASATMIIAVLSLFAGLILDTVTRGRREVKRLTYLAQESPRSTMERLARTADAKRAA
jgi:glycosyltransferase involved in cell wall biosynthesis